jgi:uncharacterized RDD family membrane protein YckC
MQATEDAGFAFQPGRAYQFAMSDREPALLGPSRDDRSKTEPETARDDSFDTATQVDTELAERFRTETDGARHPTPPPGRIPIPTRPRREAAPVFVVGFWRRLVAAAIDLGVVVPAALIIALIAGRITGLHMPDNIHLLDIDLWIDLVLATDPALVMTLVLVAAIGLVYLLVFQIVVGRTLGMRVMGLKIIDVYGDPPSAGRCVARCAGYLAGVATLFLGFLWMGFDSEKRGLQDWIAGTYVIRA